MASNALRSAGVNVPGEDFFLADTTKCYKPATEIYQGLLSHVRKSGSPQDCWLISRCAYENSLSILSAYYSTVTLSTTPALERKG